MHRGLPPRRLPLVLALSLGSATLIACGGGSSDAATSPTGPGTGSTSSTPASVQFTASSLTMDRWGDTATAAAKVLDSSGKTLTATVTYSSSDTSVVKVASGGRLTSWKDGTATITASTSGLTATATVTVQIQGNSACHVPEPPTPGPVAPPYSFTNTELVPSSVYSGSAAIPIDVDADGDMDVLQLDNDAVDESTYTGYFVYLNNGGTLTLSDKPWFGDPTPFYGPRDYAKGDINGDGLMDLYVAQPGYDPGGTDGKDCSNVTCPGTHNLVLLAQPGGGFVEASATALVPNNAHGFTHAGDMADVDCDGDPDLFQGNWHGPVASDASNLRINAGGILTEDNGRITPGPIPSVAGSSFCDLDRDGDPDLVLGPANGELQLYVNDGFGHFRKLPDGIFPPSRSGPLENINTDISCGDLNGDGLPELVAHDHSFNANFGRWVVIKNEGNMTFSAWNDVLPDPDAIYRFNAGGGPAMMYDFNGDGWMDLLGGGTLDYPMRVLFNTGGNGFVSVLVPSFGGGAAAGFQPAVADYNGDGLLDLYLGTGKGANALLDLSH